LNKQRRDGREDDALHPGAWRVPTIELSAWAVVIATIHADKSERGVSDV
jgi:hypothetical protein